MKRLFTIATAAVLALGVAGASISPADAGKRERRILAGAAIGIGAALLIDHAERKARKRRARAHYNTYERPYRRHRRAHRERRYEEPRVLYDDEPRRDYRDAPRQRYSEAPRRRYSETRRRVSSSHIGWCFDRYRSYRSSDNTFQPYHGRRKQCISPHN